MKISKNKYWQESSKWANQNKIENISILDKLAKKVNNLLENKFQIRIQRLKYHKDKTFSSRVTDEDIRLEKNELIYKQLLNLLNVFKLDYSLINLNDDLVHFDEIYLNWKKNILEEVYLIIMHFFYSYFLNN